MCSEASEQAAGSHAGVCAQRLPHPSLEAVAQVSPQLLAWQAPEGEIKDSL